MTNVPFVSGPRYYRRNFESASVLGWRRRDFRIQAFVINLALTLPAIIGTRFVRIRYGQTRAGRPRPEKGFDDTGSRGSILRRKLIAVQAVDVRSAHRWVPPMAPARACRAA